MGKRIGYGSETYELAQRGGDSYDFKARLDRLTLLTNHSACNAGFLSIQLFDRITLQHY